MNHIGFEDGKKQIETFITHLSSSYTHIGLIGFSVGATISWLCCNNPKWILLSDVTVLVYVTIFI